MKAKPEKISIAFLRSEDLRQRLIRELTGKKRISKIVETLGISEADLKKFLIHELTCRQGQH